MLPDSFEGCLCGSGDAGERCIIFQGDECHYKHVIETAILNETMNLLWTLTRSRSENTNSFCHRAWLQRTWQVLPERGSLSPRVEACLTLPNQTGPAV